jgi:hypothetical protein
MPPLWETLIAITYPFGLNWRDEVLAFLGFIMRTFLLALMLMIIAAPAFAQALGTGIPLNQEKEVTPEQLEKRRKTEEAYRATIKNIPDAKPVDPWGNMRGTDKSTGAAKSRQKKSN